MIARVVSMPLKAGTAVEFAKAMENEVIPLLRAHEGFVDEIALVSCDGQTAFGISFWESKQHAEAYNRSGYGDVMKALDSVIDGPAQLQVCDVTNSTVRRTAALLTA